MQILEAVDSGHILCIPFNPKHVSEASMDVTLGYHYYRTERIHDHPVYNPFDQRDVTRYFGEALRAVPHTEWCAENGVASLKGIPGSHPVIPLQPGERILAHTHEFFGILPPGWCEIRARSTWARNGIAVCFDAGWIDPGCINRLTLEIYNLNQRETIILPVGERIAQVLFHEMYDVEGSYSDGRDDGFSSKYQEGTDISELIEHWQPSLMLPKAYLDKRRLPPVIPRLGYKP